MDARERGDHAPVEHLANLRGCLPDEVLGEVHVLVGARDASEEALDVQFRGVLPAWIVLAPARVRAGIQVGQSVLGPAVSEHGGHEPGGAAERRLLARPRERLVGLGILVAGRFETAGAPALYGANAALLGFVGVCDLVVGLAAFSGLLVGVCDLRFVVASVWWP